MYYACDCLCKIVANELNVKSSAGAGNWASIPWLSILDSKITESTREGIYPVYLFCSDGSGVYLSLGQGMTVLTEKFGTSSASLRVKEISNYIRSEITELKNWTPGELSLKSNTALGKSYEKPNIGCKFYQQKNIPDEKTLIDDLLELVNIYKKVVNIWPRIKENNFPIYTNKNHPIVNTQTSQMKQIVNTTDLPIHPFLILAGISGTGKSRFVREQAKRSCGVPYYEVSQNPDNFCLVPVRPDWHEPSDLLGYISRINGTRYIATDFLKFIVKAWCNALDEFDDNNIFQINFESMLPYWLCLDEMNLAPVEQYFSDFLSAFESRKIIRDEYGVIIEYYCDPLIRSTTLKNLEREGVLEYFWNEIFDGIELKESELDKYKENILKYGIELPPNLIVAGTVNMDETTHGFSRKVLDRALSLDFNEFYKNDLGNFFSPTKQAKSLTFSTITQVQQSDLANTVDSNGTKTIQFVESINKILQDTPFELAYRALNQALMLVNMWGQKDESLNENKHLAAIWDDFLMMKVLPRIEGDDQKLKTKGGQDLLEELETKLKELLAEIWDDTRPDLHQESTKYDSNGKPEKAEDIECRSKAKIKWMRDRLKDRTYTSFWA